MYRKGNAGKMLSIFALVTDFVCDVSSRKKSPAMIHHRQIMLLFFLRMTRLEAQIFRRFHAIIGLETSGEGGKRLEPDGNAHVGDVVVAFGGQQLARLNQPDVAHELVRREPGDLFQPTIEVDAADANLVGDVGHAHFRVGNVFVDSFEN